MRIVAYFDSVQQLERAGRAAENAGWRIVGACSPAFNETVLESAHATRSPVAAAALIGGIVGLASGLVLTVATVREWPELIVSGKPLVSVPPILIIIFELTILGASVAAAVSFLAASARARRVAHDCWDNSTTDNRFSLLLEGAARSSAPLDDAIRAIHAREWRQV